MNRSSFEKFPKWSAKYVIADAKWRQSRGRRPVMSYYGVSNPQKALLLAKDNQFKTFIITSVDNGCFTTNDRWSFAIQEEWSITPRIGDSARFYGKGLGYEVRGLFINKTECYYRTEEQQDKKHARFVRNYDKKEKAEFEKNKHLLDQKYQDLPKFFKQRIDRFRANNPNFRWEYESYEMFCCEQAIIIAKAVRKRLKAAALKKQLTVAEFNKLRPDTKRLILNKIYNMSYQKQIEAIPNLANGHSGNTFGCSMSLAALYLYHPSYVVKLHGALSPLVGSQKYGDIS